ncbi:Hypothetical predicted protein [Pelobates cultripes]|uniref:Uncharacterized protein n=1 Tax=Pelobates cultripes TaxID=61616 RepID=A0AAD1WL92_PELCU|nr:Hypothetical predicted protein [Pelobates cultripes]
MTMYNAGHRRKPAIQVGDGLALLRSGGDRPDRWGKSFGGYEAGTGEKNQEERKGKGGRGGGGTESQIKRPNVQCMLNLDTPQERRSAD